MDTLTVTPTVAAVTQADVDAAARAARAEACRAGQRKARQARENQETERKARLSVARAAGLGLTGDDKRMAIRQERKANNAATLSLAVAAGEAWLAAEREEGRYSLGWVGTVEQVVAFHDTVTDADSRAVVVVTGTKSGATVRVKTSLTLRGLGLAILDGIND